VTQGTRGNPWGNRGKNVGKSMGKSRTWEKSWEKLGKLVEAWDRWEKPRTKMGKRKQNNAVPRSLGRKTPMKMEEQTCSWGLKASKTG
jgi:hypothetical protein